MDSSVGWFWFAWAISLIGMMGACDSQKKPISYVAGVVVFTVTTICLTILKIKGIK